MSPPPSGTAALAPALSRTARLPQIDYWRGLCLLVIFVHHLPLSFGGSFSLSAVGFTDTVIVFVFLSGFVCRLAFGSVWEKQGPAAATAKAVQRSLRLFGAHLAMTAFAVAAIVLYHELWPGEIMLDFDPASEAAVLAGPLQEIGQGALLHQHAWLCHVLPLYFLFVLAVPLLFLVLRISPWLLLLLSGGLWAAVRLTVTFSIGGFLHQSGFWLNPYAWQFVFVAGFLVSGWVRAGKLGTVRLPFLVAGAGLLVFIAAIRLRVFPQAEWFEPILNTKTMCDFSYVAYFALLAIVASPLVSTPARLARWPAVAFVSHVGQRSLGVWVGCSFLVYAAFFLRRSLEMDGWLEDLVVALFAFLPLWYAIHRGARNQAPPADPREFPAAV